MRLRRYAFIRIAIVDPVMLVCPRSALGSATLAVTTCWLLWESTVASRLRTVWPAALQVQDRPLMEQASNSAAADDAARPQSLC